MNRGEKVKKLILGCASTGAKFTPENHSPTGDALIDNISSGATIKTSLLDVAAEAEGLYGMGLRYYHYHARNPLTHEQTTDNEIYQRVSLLVQRHCDDLLISFGASRNGSEVREKIRQFGEWERVSQCALPLHLGGAHFVTIQAAVELQVICELERQGRKPTPQYLNSQEFLRDIHDYQPSPQETNTELETHSTSRGADYGRTSPAVQFDVYANAVAARQRLGLLHEVEWVQRARSHAMTRFAVEHPHIRLGSSGQLNITLLFGFSPLLPFPATYQEFKDVVDAARSLEWDLAEPGVKKRHVTISVGAAVLPQHAQDNYRPLDVGPLTGRHACAVSRLVAYAAQPDSGVDILRIGMEDTPYAVGPDGRLELADNLKLAGIVLEQLEANGAEPELDHDAVFDRMGLAVVQGDLMARQRRLPRGGQADPVDAPRLALA